MQQAAIGPETYDHNDEADFDDVEWELCCSAREASFGYLPFANLDLTRAAMEYAQIRAGMNGGRPRSHP
jgi:hypothetical protein